MNYEIGNTVIKKVDKQENKIWRDRYIYLGVPENSNIKPVTITKSVMGEGILQIGMFVRKPIEIIYDGDNENYVVEILFYNIELFEKDE